MRRLVLTLACFGLLAGGCASRVATSANVASPKPVRVEAGRGSIEWSKGNAAARAGTVSDGQGSAINVPRS